MLVGSVCEHQDTRGMAKMAVSKRQRGYYGCSSADVKGGTVCIKWTEQNNSYHMITIVNTHIASSSRGPNR